MDPIKLFTYYDLYRDGTIISYLRKNPCTLKHSKNRNGYSIVGLNHNWIRKTHYVHRLVALHFIPNTLSLRTINHIDGNKNNNSVSNLEWCSYQDNIRHAYKVLWRRSSMFGRVWWNSPLAKRVWQYSLDWILINEFECTKDIEKTLWYFATNIACACRGKQKTSNGYIWKYI